MLKDLPFNEHAAEYDEWFETYPLVFETELAAIRKLWPAGRKLMTLEIGSATGRFAKALNITEGIEPAPGMCDISEKRGVSTMHGIAESLPYGELQFDAVLMNCCISYLENVPHALKEAYRVLKYGGCLVLTFIDKNSSLGNYYQSKRTESVFYRMASFFTPEEIRQKLLDAGFTRPEYWQTLFSDLETIKSVEIPLPGYGKGSYVLVKVQKEF